MTRKFAQLLVAALASTAIAAGLPTASVADQAPLSPTPPAVQPATAGDSKRQPQGLEVREVPLTRANEEAIVGVLMKSLGIRAQDRPRRGRRGMLNKKDHHFVAYLNNKVVGAAIIGRTPPRKDQILDKSWLVEIIGVHPSHQGRGIGVALMERALQRTNNEVAVLMVKRGKKNIPARRLYEKFGFKYVKASKIPSDSTELGGMKVEQDWVGFMVRNAGGAFDEVQLTTPRDRVIARGPRPTIAVQSSRKAGVMVTVKGPGLPKRGIVFSHVVKPGSNRIRLPRLKRWGSFKVQVQQGLYLTNTLDEKKTVPPGLELVVHKRR